MRLKIKIKGPRMLIPNAKKILRLWLETPQKPLIGDYWQYYIVKNNGYIAGVIKAISITPLDIQGYICVYPFSNKRVYFHIHVTKKMVVK